MNTDRSVEPQAALTVTELETRFEMEALPVLPGGHPTTDWSCACSFTF
jgi:hypothetical protein